MVEITDNATIRMKRARYLNAVMALVCPYPLKYRQVWHFARGDKSFYAWKPLAPDNFVALGIMCTTSEEPPSVKAMRCVPLSWCVPSKVKPAKIWDDTGAGGGKPGSMWTVNSMDMLTVVPGHDPPTETFYDLSSNRFFLEGFPIPKDRKEVNSLGR